MSGEGVEQVRDTRIDCTDGDGAACGWIEVDGMGTTGLLLEVFDASHFDGKVTSAVTFLTFEQARRLAAAIVPPPTTQPRTPAGSTEEATS